MPATKARYWIATIPANSHWIPRIDDKCVYIKGQQEVGEGENGYTHWQILLAFSKQVTLLQCKTYCTDTSHVEPTRSEAADDYVWKEETRVEGTQFELGKKSMKRNAPTDWDSVLADAKAGQLTNIPSDVLVRCYSQIRKISVDFMDCPDSVVKEVRVYYGKTGAGKTCTAKLWLGPGYFKKIPTSKFWDGYRPLEQKSILIDEYRGEIGISHLLRWFDIHGCLVETKGSGLPLLAEKIAVTSNLPPENWFPNLDVETMCALRRRIKCFRFIAMNEFDEE